MAGAERRLNPRTGQWEVIHVGSDTDEGSLADRASVVKKQQVNLGSKERIATGAGGPPKQEPGESLEAFMARMRKFREEQEAQKAAILKMKTQ